MRYDYMVCNTSRVSYENGTLTIAFQRHRTDTTMNYVTVVR